MGAPRQMTDLEIVGYATALDETMVPSVVPPVFRVKAEPSRILFPPYTFSGGSVWNATEGNEHDLKELAEDGEITRFAEPEPSQPDFELWVDQGMAPHYEPRALAEETLRGIAEESIRQARGAFAKGDYAGADRLCGVALSADDRLVEALAIKAAVCRQHGDSVGERVMAKLASTSLGPKGFESLVEACWRSRPGEAQTPEGAVPSRPLTDLFRLRPMYGMAANKPQPVKPHLVPA